MESGPPSCAFCTKSFPSTDKWIPHYNSQHSTEYRAPIFGHQTCKNCHKFIPKERWSTHSCRKSASTRIDASSTTQIDPPASEDPANVSVDLEAYLIPRNAPVARAPTASSTPRVSSIVGAPGDRNQGHSSLPSTGHHRGEAVGASVAGADTPGRQPGDRGGAGGGPPSKQAEAGPAADRAADSRRHSAVAESRGRPLRSSSRLQRTSPTAATGRTLRTGTRSNSSRAKTIEQNTQVEQSNTQVEQSNTQVEQSSTQVEQSSIQVEQSSIQVEQSSIQVEQSSTQVEQSSTQVEQSSTEAEQSLHLQVEPNTSVTNRRDYRAALLLPGEPPSQSALASTASSHQQPAATNALRRSSRVAATTQLPQVGSGIGSQVGTQVGSGVGTLARTQMGSGLGTQVGTQMGTQVGTQVGSPAACPPLSVIASFFPEVNDDESIPSVSAVSSPHSNDVDSLSLAQHGKHCCPHPQCNKHYSAVQDAVKHINRDHKDHFPLPTTYARCSVCKNVYTKGGLKNHKCRGPLGGHALPRTPQQQPHSPEPLRALPEPFPPVAPDPDIDTLHSFYKLELTWTHVKWSPLLRRLLLLLLQKTNSPDVTTSDESFSAFLLLPGFLEAVRIATRLPGAKQLRIERPIDYLMAFTATEHIEHPAKIILTTAKALHTRLRHSLASRPCSHSNQKSKALSKICALTQIGRISKAARLADNLARADNSDDGLPTSQVTRDRAISALPELFPADSVLDDLGEQIDDEWDHGRPLQITASDVAAAIAKLSIDRASGSSGWSNRLLKHLYVGSEPNDQQLIADAFASFFNKLLKGRVSDHIRSYLTDVRLCLIPKSDNPLLPTYRPIGVGETIFRLLGRTILAKIGKDIGKKIAPHQLAVGIPGGVEIAASIAGMLEAINDSQTAEDTPFAMMSIDIKNAFNSIRRSYVLQGLRNYCPSLIPFFSIVYGKAVNLRWSDGSVIGKASTGVIQGDPLSTLYFALGMQPLLIELNAKLRRIQADRNHSSYSKPGLLFAIADDITILARTETLFELSASLPSLFARYDLPLNQSKTWIMGPQVHLQDGETNLPCRTMRDGGKILGTPVGDIHFILSWLHDHFRDNSPPLQILGNLPARAAVTLLKFSYNSRMDYLRKTSSEVVVNTGIFAEYDALIDSAILTTGIADDRDRIHALRALPLNHGGLGMPHLDGHNGRRHQLVTAMRGREFLKSFYPHFLRDHVATFNAKNVDIDGTPPDEIAETLYELRERHPMEDALYIFAIALRKWVNNADTDAAANFHQQLLSNDEDAAAAVFLSTQGVKQSFLLFSTSHRLHPEVRLSNKEYIEAARFLLLAPFKMNVEGFSTCRCRRENPWDLLTHPFHSSNCPLNSMERTFRHSAVCSLLCKLLRKASPTSQVSSEPRDSTAAIHPDIAVEEDALLFHVDVSIVEPTSVHALAENGGSATTKGAAARLMEAAKFAKYQGTEWVNVVPFVLESTGHLGKEAEALLDKITADKKALRAWFLETLSLILARSQGKMRLKSHALLR